MEILLVFLVGIWLGFKLSHITQRRDESGPMSTGWSPDWKPNNKEELLKRSKIFVTECGNPNYYQAVAENSGKVFDICSICQQKTSLKEWDGKEKSNYISSIFTCEKNIAKKPNLS